MNFAAVFYNMHLCRHYVPVFCKKTPKMSEQFHPTDYKTLNLVSYTDFCTVIINV